MSANPSSYYHACVCYPADYIRKYIGSLATDDFMKLLDELAFQLDCDYMVSPLHSPGNDGEKKQHFHCIFRNSNKLTGNSFQAKLVDVLHGDMRGIAYSPTECCLTKPTRYIRYLVHYDNPKKEVFRKENIAYLGNWNKELYNAFGDEILSDMSDLITSGACCSIADLINIYDCGYALRQGHNMYYINSLINEIKKEYLK